MVSALDAAQSHARHILIAFRADFEAFDPDHAYAYLGHSKSVGLTQAEAAATAERIRQCVGCIEATTARGRAHSTAVSVPKQASRQRNRSRGIWS